MVSTITSLPMISVHGVCFPCNWWASSTYPLVSFHSPMTNNAVWLFEILCVLVPCGGLALHPGCTLLCALEFQESHEKRYKLRLDDYLVSIKQCVYCNFHSKMWFILYSKYLAYTVFEFFLPSLSLLALYYLVFHCSSYLLYIFGLLAI